MSLLTFEVSNTSKFGSAGALRDFLETQWADHAGHFQACWLDEGHSLASQLGNLAKAQPLSAWATDNDTPLREILENDAITTWFQPIFEREGLALWGYECLARAVDSAQRIISPADLLSWADTENLLFRLDRVCREIHITNAAKVDSAHNLNFLINFLPTVIYDPSVCLRTTFTAARKSGLPAKQIIFEVVESEKINDREFLKKILDEYRAAGFRVALDDMGAGEAGLQMLADISPDLIKIDRQLVAKSTSSDLHRVICSSIVQIAKATGKKVLAEGVETEAEYRLFHDLEVDLFQGYYFGRPAADAAKESLVAPLPS